MEPLPVGALAAPRRRLIKDRIAFMDTREPPPANPTESLPTFIASIAILPLHMAVAAARGELMRIAVDLPMTD
jgi:hypothetical protein